MKASLKFRDEQQPLVRAKIPLSILGLPFFSGITAGETKDLRLDLGTAFESGPSLRILYRPNDSRNPFSFILKTGAGSLGSPYSSPLTMSAEFGLSGRGTPSFTVQIKPRLGDFFLRKSATSAPGSFPQFLAADSSSDLINPSGFFSKKPYGIHDLIAGLELTSQSVIPVRNKAELKFRWSARMPEIKPCFINFAEREPPFYGISRCKLPLLVMSKISVEQVRENPDKKPDNLISAQKQIDVLREETGIIRSTLEELRAELRSSKRSISNGTSPLKSVSERSPSPSKSPEPARSRDGRS